MCLNPSTKYTHIALSIGHPHRPRRGHSIYVHIFKLPFIILAHILAGPFQHATSFVSILTHINLAVIHEQPHAHLFANHADLDPAILRPGRLGHHLRLSLPALEARRDIAAWYLGRVPLASGGCERACECGP